MGYSRKEGTGIVWEVGEGERNVDGKLGIGITYKPTGDGYHCV